MSKVNPAELIVFILSSCSINGMEGLRFQGGVLYLTFYLNISRLYHVHAISRLPILNIRGVPAVLRIFLPSNEV